jgi:hypothetical protein
MAADKSLYSRLSRLFNTNVIVRKVGKDKLRVVDNDHLQSVGNAHNSKYMDRFTRLHGVKHSTSTGYNPNYNYFSSKTELYTDYEVMDSDSIIASALDIYADECLSGDTKIPLLDGRICTIKELYESNETGIWLYGLDTDGTMKPVQASHVACNGSKPVYKLTLEDGTEVKCTSNHQWVKTDLSIITTDKLNVGDGIYDLNIDNVNNFINSNNHKIIKIEYVGEEIVYDIVNAGDNHLFAIQCNDGSKLFTHNCVLKDDFGEILSIKSDDENVKKILYNLFYDILNIEFNLWPWVRNMCKYGDSYLLLDIQDEIGIVNVTPKSAYEIIREEGMDINNPYHVQFKQLGSGNLTYENYEIAHFRLLSDSNFLPYGKSMIEPARKVWKQLTLMEDAMLIHRVMRAPEKRIFKIDVGNIPPNEIDNHIQKIINQMKKTPYKDPQTGDYNLKFNMNNMLEDFFLPVRGGQSGTEIDTLSGMEWTGIDDIEYLRNKMMAALKVPKAFLGYEEGLSGKATLAAEDVRFARTIERIQRIIISELYKIAIIHLYAQGYSNADLINFELSMTAPSTVYEQEKLTLYTSKVDLAGSMLEKKLFSTEWIYKNIFNFTDDAMQEIQVGIIQDQKEQYRMTQISEQGEDPATKKEEPEEPESKEGEEGTGKEGEEGAGEEAEGKAKEGEAENPFEENINTELQKQYDLRKNGTIQPKVPKGGWPGAGRPKEPIKYNSHEHPRGYDPIGRVAWKNARNEAVSAMHKYASKKAKLINETKSKGLLDENNLIHDDI